MKSLLISGTYFPPQVGGISEIMRGVASALGPDRVCCLIGVPASGGVPGDAFKPRIYRRPAAFAKAGYIQALAWGMAITQIMIREQPQVVQLANAYEGYLGLWLRRWLRLPYVVYAYGNEILQVMHTQTGYIKPRLALQQADRVLAISQFTANLVQRTGVAQERIDIVYPGCDVDHFRPLPPSMDLRKKLLGERFRDRVILSIGNLVARKGHDMVIQALPRLRQSIPDVSYLIVGDGPYRMELESLAAAMGVQDRVIFAGKIPNKDLPPIYALSEVFVMASREQLEACDVEGFGVVFLEANACAKPVVGGRSGGIPDAVIDGITGFLVTPDDPEDIATVLTRLLRDRDLASRLGEQGRSRAVREFNWPHIAARVQAILDCVVQERSACRRFTRPTPNHG